MGWSSRTVGFAVGDLFCSPGWRCNNSECYVVSFKGLGESLLF
jgi:hypothetical protein